MGGWGWAPQRTVHCTIDGGGVVGEHRGMKIPRGKTTRVFCVICVAVGLRLPPYLILRDYCCVYLLGAVPAPEDVSDEIVLANTFLNSLSNPVPAEAPTRGRDRDVKSAGGLRRPRLTWIDDPRRRPTPGKAKVRQGVCGRRGGGAMGGEWWAFFTMHGVVWDVEGCMSRAPSLLP